MICSKQPSDYVKTKTGKDRAFFRKCRMGVIMAFPFREGDDDLLVVRSSQGLDDLRFRVVVKRFLFAEAFAGQPEVR